MALNLTGDKRVLNDHVATLNNTWVRYCEMHNKVCVIAYKAFPDPLVMDFDTLGRKVNEMKELVVAIRQCSTELQSLGTLHSSAEAVYHNWPYSTFGVRAAEIFSKVSQHLYTLTATLRILNASPLTAAESNAIFVDISNVDSSLAIIDSLVTKLTYEANLQK